MRFSVLSVLLPGYALCVFNQILPEEKEENMHIKDQIRYHGYPIIEYTVNTIDGYKLGIHRIPGPKGTSLIDGLKMADGKEPVMLMHGISGSSQYFVSSGPGDEDGMGKSIPYQMVDTGKYDVWMMNARGNYFSRDHMWLNPDT